MNGGGPSSEFFHSYQLLHEIGAGATAKVYRARHVHPGYAERSYAIKILLDDWKGSDMVRGLFRNEGYILCSLDHPNIVKTLEAGIEDNRPYLAMEYIDGRDLWTLIDRVHQSGSKLPIPLSMHIITEMLRGLAFAHRMHDPDGNSLAMVHRDMNPANVFLSFDGHVKVGDFGVAVRAGADVTADAVAGTAGYFAPEQMEPGKLETSVDVFGCGAIMYAMLCGRPPFEAENQNDTLSRNQHVDYVKPARMNPELAEEVDEVIMRALQKRPGKRYADAEEMLRALIPHAGVIPGMRLAVAGMMRSAFLPEYVQEIQLRMGLSGEGADSLGREVGLISPTEAPDLHQMLATKHFNVHHGSTEELLSDDKHLNATILDLRGANVTADALLSKLETRKRSVPLIVINNALNADTIRVAHDLDAVDMIFGPLQPDRLASALWVAVAGQTRAERHHPEVEGHTDSELVRLLFVSTDESLGNDLKRALRKRGYDLERVADTSGAIERLHTTTPGAAVYDAQPPITADATGFANVIRETDGIGILPIIYLAESNDRPTFAGIERSAVRPRSEPPLVLATALNRLRADGRPGRAFVRYRVELPADLQYGGRGFKGTTTDISRGGVMVRAPSIPKVGTLGSVELHLDAETRIYGRGRVVRVMEAPGGGGGAAVGLEFTRLGSGDEAALIALVRKLGFEQAG